MNLQLVKNVASVGTHGVLSSQTISSALERNVDGAIVENLCGECNGLAHNLQVIDRNGVVGDLSGVAGARSVIGQLPDLWGTCPG